MKLTKFRVKNYKTIEDTGWIDNDQIGCLVGVNESGKTNIITALLKLNPVDETTKMHYSIIQEVNILVINLN